MEMEKLDLGSVHKRVNGDPVKGVVLVSSYDRRKTKNDKPFIDGTLKLVGGGINFKIWAGSICTDFIKYDYNNVVIYLSATIAVFNDAKYLEINHVQVLDGYSPEDFMNTPYDKNLYSKGLEDLARQNTSDKGFDLLTKILFSNPDKNVFHNGSGEWGNQKIYDRFKVEFAAKSVHDACKSGLLGHTYKILYFLISSIGLYPNILKERDDLGELVFSQDRKDLLVIGSILHDIGKTLELHYGVYQPNTALTHRMLGMEYLYQFKDDIVSAYGDKWYYDLLSIVVQHHHIYDEKARTLPAYIIHLIDMFESGLTRLSDKIESGGDLATSGEVLKVDRDTHLHM